MRRAFFLLGFGLLSACATHNTKVDCHHIDWYQQGLDDGTVGAHHDDFSKVFPNCVPNLVIDNHQYEMGYANGLKSFCKPEQAYDLGLSNKPKPDNCPAQLKPAFDKSYQLGLSQYQTVAPVKAELDRVSDSLEVVRQHLLAEKQRLRQLKQNYAEEPFSPQKQYHIRRVNLKIRSLTEQEKQLSNEKRSLTGRYQSLIKK